MILKLSDTKPGKLVASYGSRYTEPEHVIFEDEAKKSGKQSMFAYKSPAECVRFAPRLKCVTKILPSGMPLHDLYALESKKGAEANLERKDASGYIRAVKVYMWG